MKRTIIIKDEPDLQSGSRGRGRHGLRVVLSLGCALVADGLQWLIPPTWMLCDGVMVVALLLIWGWRWEIAVAVVPEVIPGFDLFPTWTLFVAYLAVVRRREGGPVVDPSAPRPMKQVGPP